MRALNGIGDDSEVGRTFFDKMSSVFLERFRLTFEKHVVAQWRSPKLIHYMLGGCKHHAHAFARWLMDCEGQSMNDVLEAPYEFPNRQVVLGKHHKMTHGDVVVNLRESMEWLTSELDREEIRQNHVHLDAL